MERLIAREPVRFALISYGFVQTLTILLLLGDTSTLWLGVIQAVALATYAAMCEDIVRRNVTPVVKG